MKNTAEAIQKVRDAASNLSQKLPDKLSFLNKKDFRTWISKRAKPTGLTVFDDMAKDQQTALKTIYKSLGHAGLGVVCNLLECFEKHDATKDERNTSLCRLAESIWAVQGGLTQLRLVDDQARRFVGQILSSFEDENNTFAMKYTGGANGGYLLYICPPGTSLDFLRNNLIKNLNIDTENELELPSCDYNSTYDEPKGKGLEIARLHPKKMPERWDMICYRAEGDSWIKDEDLSEKNLPDWKWEQLLSESESKPNWCMLDLDFRNRNEHEGASSQIFICNRGLTTHRSEMTGTRKGAGKGEVVLAHMVHIVCKNGGQCTKEEIEQNISALGQNIGLAYLDTPYDIRKHFLKKVESLQCWKQIFTKFKLRSYTTKNTYDVKVRGQEKSRVFVYLRHSDTGVTPPHHR